MNTYLAPPLAHLVTQLASASVAFSCFAAHFESLMVPVQVLSAADAIGVAANRIATASITSFFIRKSSLEINRTSGGSLRQIGPPTKRGPTSRTAAASYTATTNGGP